MGLKQKKKKKTPHYLSKKLTAAYLKQFMTAKELDGYVMQCCIVIFLEGRHDFTEASKGRVSQQKIS